MAIRTSAARLAEPLKYCGVGAFNTTVATAVMALLAASGVNYIAYTLAGYGVGFLASYVGNALFTFRVGRTSTRAFVRFVLLNAALLASVQALQYVLIEWASLRELFVVVGCIVIYTCIGFFLNRRFVFARAAQ